MNIIRVILCILVFVYAYTQLRKHLYDRDNWVYKLVMALVVVLILFIVIKWI
jgi:hypothetical protein